jgi:hypothetical protein
LVALIVGIVFVLFAVYSVLPLPGWGLNWWHDVLLFLRGGVPIIAVLVGIVAVFIGIADIKDRIEAKREEAEEAEGAESASGTGETKEKP